MLTQEEAVIVQLGLISMGLQKIISKRKGYSGENDPYGNLRTSFAVDVEPWRGVMVRCMDKISRRKQFNITHGEGMDLSEEGWADPHFDHINYIAIEGGLSLEELFIHRPVMAAGLMERMYEEANGIIDVITKLREEVAVDKGD